MSILWRNYLLSSELLLAFLLLCFIISMVKKRNDIADVAWGLGFLLVAIFSYYLGGLTADLGLLSTTLVTIWSIRLATHIYLRNKNRDEDPRYKVWREQWGKWFYPRSFMQVFLLQGALLLLVISPVVITNTFRVTSIGWVAVLGFTIWIVGFLFESVGDLQLKRFIKNPNNKGKIMRYGLWRYTRHPNYFGEVTQWWGLWVIALSSPYGWLGIIGPITITILILKVSGVPLLERQMAKNPEFKDYVSKTSVFIPLPPKNNNNNNNSRKK